LPLSSADFRIGRRLLALLFVASCAQPVADPARPPALEEIWLWLHRVIPELPKLIKLLESAGRISDEIAGLLQYQAQSLNELVAKFDELAPGQDPTAVINDIGTMIDAILLLIPQTAPFVPLLVALRTLLIAYLKRQAIAPMSPPTERDLDFVKAQTAK
jgi:hypothetical protein